MQNKPYKQISENLKIKEGSARTIVFNWKKSNLEFPKSDFCFEFKKLSKAEIIKLKAVLQVEQHLRKLRMQQVKEIVAREFQKELPTK